jgi:hypothetical protein
LKVEGQANRQRPGLSADYTDFRRWWPPANALRKPWNLNELPVCRRDFLAGEPGKFYESLKSLRTASSFIFPRHVWIN